MLERKGLVPWGLWLTASLKHQGSRHPEPMSQPVGTPEIEVPAGELNSRRSNKKPGLVATSKAIVPFGLRLSVKVPHGPVPGGGVVPGVSKTKLVESALASVDKAKKVRNTKAARTFVAFMTAPRCDWLQVERAGNSIRAIG